MSKKNWVLLDKSDNEVRVGDTVTDFRGDEVEVKSFDPPHKWGSVGRVVTTHGLRYAAVYDLRYKFVEEEVN